MGTTLGKPTRLPCNCLCENLSVGQYRVQSLDLNGRVINFSGKSFSVTFRRLRLEDQVNFTCSFHSLQPEIIGVLSNWLESVNRTTIVTLVVSEGGMAIVAQNSRNSQYTEKHVQITSEKWF